MQFPGSDGQAVSVADVRRVAILAKSGKGVSLPLERRPTGAVVATMKV